MVTNWKGPKLLLSAEWQGKKKSDLNLPDIEMKHHQVSFILVIHHGSHVQYTVQEIDTKWPPQKAQKYILPLLQRMQYQAYQLVYPPPPPPPADRRYVKLWSASSVFIQTQLQERIITAKNYTRITYKQTVANVQHTYYKQEEAPACASGFFFFFFDRLFRSR